jgi:hypothetical protein
MGYLLNLLLRKSFLIFLHDNEFEKKPFTSILSHSKYHNQDISNNGELSIGKYEKVAYKNQNG